MFWKLTNHPVYNLLTLLMGAINAKITNEKKKFLKKKKKNTLN